MRKIFRWLWYWYLYDYNPSSKKHQQFIVSLLKWDIGRRWEKQKRKKYVSDISE